MLKFFDDLSSLPPEYSKTISNVFDGFVTQTLDRAGIVKMAKPAAGNLSAEQLQAGMYPGNPSINQNNPNAGGLMNSLGFGSSSGSNNLLMIGLVVGAVGLASYLVFKK